MKPRGSNTTRCPHCGSICATVKTKQISPTYREVTFLCLNDECNFLFVAEITPVRTLEAPSRPNPDVHIPSTNRGAA